MVDPDVYYSRFPEDHYHQYEYYASLARPEFFDEDISHNSSYSSPAQRSFTPAVLNEPLYDNDPPTIDEEPVPDVIQIKKKTKKVKTKKKKKFTCSHCKKPTIRKHIHPKTGLIVCRSCYLFFQKYGRDKKLVVEICSNCKLLMGDKEHPVTAVSLCRCQNCKTNKSEGNHPVTDIALCKPCLAYYKRNGRDRSNFSRDQSFRKNKLNPIHSNQHSFHKGNQY
ncbi:hypothetical protein GCK72_021538 [Caenorhabditis remanei]|uniref:GATA-type domain-containing protein n=1 Tax=Caenorhabditis remanei TaxID=31234 RepID=A0A6A5GKD3_CAERE|nr:hypothetical protein GCK72_021538 [Caenorhabditis remanei]KAF1754972.1 hypothetical protein GCK72_021538 [Caenorhabditis remanei]